MPTKEVIFGRWKLRAFAALVEVMQEAEEDWGAVRTMGGLNEQKVLAIIITAAILLIAWMVRFEWAGRYGFYHRNRFTGVVCYRTTECWFTSER
jgi:hypothetical protein